MIRIYTLEKYLYTLIVFISDWQMNTEWKVKVKVYYNKLKVVGENGIKQKIYYIMGMLGIKAR